MKGQKLKKIYDVIRILNVYALVFFILLILQKYTIGLLINLEKIVVFGKEYPVDVLFYISSLILIKLFIKADVPRGKEKEHFFMIKRVSNNHN